MGGFGSGNHGGKALVENCLSLDINRMNRDGMLHGWHGKLVWRDSYGEKTGSVTLTSNADLLTVTGQLKGKPWDQSFAITRTPSHFGGSRPWFLCPYCSRRVGKLYIGNDGFACRKCYRLVHASTREDAEGRLQLRKRKLEARLDEDGQKPRGMHWLTYERICNQLDNLEGKLERQSFVSALLILGR